MSEFTIHNGDCLDFLRTLADGSVDAIVTDPPYGIAHKSHGTIFLEATPCHADESTAAMESMCAWASTKDLPLVCFFSPYAPPNVKWRSILSWSKGAHVGGGGDMATCWKRDFELIGVRNNGPLSGQRDSSVLHFHALSPPPSGHFCEKPVRLMRYLIEKVVPIGATVLDPFMGSGSTGVACMETGRNFIGIEIDAKYCDIARKRIKSAQDQGRLFSAP